MDKNAIKKYAVWARRELISRVSQRAAQYEITADGYGDQNATSVHGRILSADEKKQRSALIAQIRDKGYEQVMEEIAYTWFNRFSALRFMEVNAYLPTRVRVFTDDENNFKPQILTEAINMELDGLDMQKVYDLKNANDDDALFKYMIIVQCNALSKILPGMFQRISDYTELLFPDNLLREGSVVEQMIAMIPQEDWTDQVQIIGWLYQYYNSELKDQVFANLKKNIKITKENIPAATQLFTPDWIVRYMVENSLGRLWLEGHPNDELKAKWKYYLDEAEQEPKVLEELDVTHKEYAALKPEDILAIDPCQGSGHMLAYMFDILVQIYGAYGYSAREAVVSIVERNIWGLDIDERAAQLAYFSVMMKARQYDRRFFSRGIQPHVYAIIESNNLDPHCIEYFVNGRKELKSAMDTLVKELHDAKDYGSILTVSPVNFDALYSRFEEIKNEIIPGIYKYQALDALLPFVQVAQVLSQKYHVTITNPPYMGNGGMSDKLAFLVKEKYEDGKTDLFSTFILRNIDFTKQHGFISMITMESWMFLSSFEKLRTHIYKELTPINMVHMPYLGKGGTSMGISFGTTAFIIVKESIKKYIAQYDEIRYYETDDNGVPLSFPVINEGYKQASVEKFVKIPGSPVAYWASDTLADIFATQKPLNAIAQPKQGLATGDNNRFLRLWFEPSITRIGFGIPDRISAKRSGYKWFPCNKGGDFRKWFGNNNYIVNWENDGIEIRNFKDEKGKLRSRPQNMDKYFRCGLTWSTLSSANLSMRFSPEGYLFETKGSVCFFSSQEEMLYSLGVLNSIIVNRILLILCPTLDFHEGPIGRIPLVVDKAYKDEVIALVKRNIQLSKEDWDERETSFDFSTSPMLQDNCNSLKTAYGRWKERCEKRFLELQKNEERLNEIFLHVYGLSEELSAEVLPEEVTVRIPTHKEAIREILSFAVGCMFGRYSLDRNGISFAGGTWDPSKYTTYLPDKDAIIPICDDEYFRDDISSRFVQFIETICGKDTLEENLRFIAEGLNGKGSPRDVIRDYFINCFYADHCSMYSITGSGKRPIYWLFDSGKKNGFKCLIYMHRYQPDTIARIRTDYVHEQQSRYRTAINDLESRAVKAGTSERLKLTKKLNSIKAQAEELRIYEEKIHHLADQMIKIDLDDGVKANYAKFQDVLAKIK